MNEAPAQATRRETRAIWGAAVALLLFIAICGIATARLDVRSAIPYGLIFVATAFALWYAARAGRRTNRRVRLAEARLRAAAEALPDGLVILDRDDRIVYFNSRYPEHLVEPLRESLAIGRRFEDWLREGLYSGPIYHEEMGASFIDDRLARRSEAPYEHVHRVADGDGCASGKTPPRTAVASCCRPTSPTREAGRHSCACSPSRSSRRGTRWKSPTPAMASPT